MILLSKKHDDGTYFEFDKILISGYNIKEDCDRITQKFVNGKRKQIISDYTDCSITINLDTFDSETTNEYLKELTNGIYKYYSIQEKKFKEAEFVISEIPELIVESAIGDNVIIEDYNITLLRAGD